MAQKPTSHEDCPLCGFAETLEDWAARLEFKVDTMRRLGVLKCESIELGQAPHTSHDTDVPLSTEEQSRIQREHLEALLFASAG